MLVEQHPDKERERILVQKVVRLRITSDVEGSRALAHRVGAYVRISDDIDGKGLGVSRQLEDCRVLSAARRWEVVGVYEDNDVSAFKRRVVRPEFERLLGDLDGGLIDGVVVYDLDRFARKPSDRPR